MSFLFNENFTIKKNYWINSLDQLCIQFLDCLMLIQITVLFKRQFEDSYLFLLHKNSTIITEGLNIYIIFDKPYKKQIRVSSKRSFNDNLSFLFNKNFTIKKKPIDKWLRSIIHTINRLLHAHVDYCFIIAIIEKHYQKAS